MRFLLVFVAMTLVVGHAYGSQCSAIAFNTVTGATGYNWGWKNIKLAGLDAEDACRERTNAKTLNHCEVQVAICGSRCALMSFSFVPNKQNDYVTPKLHEILVSSQDEQLKTLQKMQDSCSECTIINTCDLM